MRKIKVLFVCLGNICRSPLAEGIFNSQLIKLNNFNNYSCDSAATSTYQIGDPPDRRSILVAEKYGVKLNHIARQITITDLHNFDYIIAMDFSNHDNIKKLAENNEDLKAKVKMMMDFHPDKNLKEVPDPYYGDMVHFENVYQLLNVANEGLIKFLDKTHFEI